MYEYKEGRTSYAQQRAIGELRLDGLLDLGVRHEVDRRPTEVSVVQYTTQQGHIRSLIHDNHPTILHQRARQAKQRPLPDTQVRAIRLDERVQRDAVLVVMLAVFLLLESRAVRRGVLRPH